MANMKKNFKFIFLFLWGISLFSCKDDDHEITPQDYFDALQPDSILFKTTAGKDTILLKTNLEVTPVIPAEATSWCQVEFYPIPPRIIIKASENHQGEARSAKVILQADKFQHTLYIEQLGKTPAIRLLKDTYRVGQGDTTLLIPFVANITPEINSLASWITSNGVTQNKHTDTLYLKISSTREIRRMGDVELSYQANCKQVVHIIQQSDDTTYVPASASSMFSKVKVSRVESTPEGEKLEELYDGETSTTWQTHFSSVPIDLDFYFENVEQIDQFIYYPGFWQNYPLEKFEIYVKCQGDNDFKRYEEPYDFQGKGTNQIINFTQSIINPQVIRFHILTAKEMIPGQYYLSAGEFEFYQQNTNIADIFTDATCSELKEGITIDQILSMKDEFLRNIAQHLHAGTYESEFRVQEYLPYADPDKQKENHISRAWGFLDNATGITVDKNEELVIFVGDTHGEQVGLYISNWERDDHPNPNLISPLAEGINVINQHKDGFLYITYLTDQPQNKKPIKIHIASGKVNGYFDITKTGHNNSYWQNLLSTRAKYKYLDVKGEWCHLIFLTEDYLTYCPTDIESLISVCDSVIYLEHELSGIYKYKQTRMYPNRMLCRYTTETGDFLAHASDYFTCFIRGAVKGILDVHTLRTEPWAIAHELGHVHQHRNLTWKEMTEVSNNVFSLYVQTSFGNTSRLYKDKEYQSAYDKLTIPGYPYNYMEEAYDYYFIKLVPLWQLQLYFSKVMDQPDFYLDLYEKMRQQGELNSDKEKHLNFVKLCCEIGKADLTEFFSFYGFFTPHSVSGENEQPKALFEITQNDIEQTTAAIKQMKLSKPLALQYLNDGNINLFRQNKAVQQGSVQLSGNTLTLTDWQNVVAYEVRKAGKLIQISQEPEFTLEEKGTDISVLAIAANGSVTPVKLN